MFEWAHLFVLPSSAKDCQVSIQNKKASNDSFIPAWAGCSLSVNVLPVWYRFFRHRYVCYLNFFSITTVGPIVFYSWWTWKPWRGITHHGSRDPGQYDDLESSTDWELLWTVKTQVCLLCFAVIFSTFYGVTEPFIKCAFLAVSSKHKFLFGSGTPYTPRDVTPEL